LESPPIAYIGQRAIRTKMHTVVNCNQLIMMLLSIITRKFVPQNNNKNSLKKLERKLSLIVPN